ncbi:hypothetical protein HHK36_029700 [Tetracentron sinense]|uniref:Histone deacetylase interacting domain-containing protein n=1 Tax=Tetracentron sinense TaxID=13715 RepID=A0A834YEE9_TETSI|nr:hypothetical protein HHK36_029700 [Tetracentron sinense]
MKSFHVESVEFFKKIMEVNVYESFLLILYERGKENTPIVEVGRQVSALFCNHPDLFNEFLHFLPDPSSTDPWQHVPWGRNSSAKTCGITFSLTPQPTHSSQPPLLHDCSKYTRFGEKHRRKSKLLRVDMEKQTLHDSCAYLKNMKCRFRDKTENYKQFLQLVTYFNAKIIKYADFIAKVEVLLGGHGKLISGLNVFLPYGYEITIPQPPLMKSFNVESAEFFKKIKETFQGDDHVYKSFLLILYKRGKENTPITEVSRQVSALFYNHPDLFKEFLHFLPDPSSTDPWQHVPCGRNSSAKRGRTITSHVPDHGKAFMKVDHEQRKRPKKDKQRIELGALVLDDNRAFVTSERKHMCKDQYKECKLKWEDARFEVDLVLLRAAGTITAVEKLLDKIKDNAFTLDNPITINLRCIEQIYGEYGLEVMDALHKNPTIVLPLILTRLQQKKVEWKTWCSGFAIARARYSQAWRSRLYMASMSQVLLINPDVTDGSEWRRFSWTAIVSNKAIPTTL